MAERQQKQGFFGFGTYQCFAPDEDSDDSDHFNNCMICQQVCATFPFENICRQLASILKYSRYCFSRNRERVFDILASRPGGLSYLASNKFLEDILKNTADNDPEFMSLYEYFSYFHSDRFEEYCGEKGWSGEEVDAKMDEIGTALIGKRYEPLIYHLTPYDVGVVELIEFAAEKFNVRWNLSKEALALCFGVQDLSIRYLLDKNLYDVLVAVGVSSVALVFDAVDNIRDLVRLAEV